MTAKFERDSTQLQNQSFAVLGPFPAYWRDFVHGEEIFARYDGNNPEVLNLERPSLVYKYKGRACDNFFLICCPVPVMCCCLSAMRLQEF